MPAAFAATMSLSSSLDMVMASIRPQRHSERTLQRFALMGREMDEGVGLDCTVSQSVCLTVELKMMHKPGYLSA